MYGNIPISTILHILLIIFIPLLVLLIISILVAIAVGEIQHRHHVRQRELAIMEKEEQDIWRAKPASSPTPHTPFVLSPANQDTSFAAYHDGSWSSFGGDSDPTEAISYSRDEFKKLVIEVRTARDECNDTAIDNLPEYVFQEIQDFHNDFDGPR